MLVASLDGATMPGRRPHLAIILTTLLALNVPAEIPAQNTQDAFTVRRAIELARAHHPAIAAAAQRGRASMGLVRQEAALPNPVLEWRAENFASPLQPDRFVTVSQPLDLTARRFALRSELRDLGARVVAESAAVTRTIEAEAARAFWRASRARALLDVVEGQRADALRLATYEANRASEGEVAELTAMRASLEAERVRLTEGVARAEWVRARADLARATGLNVDALPEIPALLADVTSATPLPTPDAAIGAALERRKDLAALRAGVLAARSRLAAERRGMLPDVVLQAGTKETAGYATRTVGVALPLPFFDRNSGARERAAALLAVAESDLRLATQSTRVEVSAAIDALQALLDAGSPGQRALAGRSAEVAAIADTAYAEGGLSLLEVLDARRTSADLRAAALRWTADMKLARLELNRVMGAPLLESLEIP